MPPKPDVSSIHQFRRFVPEGDFSGEKCRSHFVGSVTRGAGGGGGAQVDRERIARKHDSRALTITPIGWANIERTFGCSLHDHTVQQRSALRVVAGWPPILGIAAARKLVHMGHAWERLG